MVNKRYADYEGPSEWDDLISRVDQLFFSSTMTIGVALQLSEEAVRKNRRVRTSGMEKEQVKKIRDQERLLRQQLALIRKQFPGMLDCTKGMEND